MTAAEAGLAPGGAEGAAPRGARAREAGWLWPVAGAAAIAGLVLLLRGRPVEALLRGMDPDSAMRLVQVRDLLGGQGWFDMTQHRLGLDAGVEMHWSRLVDAPMAGFLWAAGRFIDPSRAEHLLLLLWPILWLAVTAWAVLSLSRRLGGPVAGIAAFFSAGLVLLSTPIVLPGALDHHNVQLSLMMLALWGFASRHAVRGGAAVSGLCAATSLVVGIELVPVMATLCAGVALVWTLGGASERRAAVEFGSALAAGLAGQFLLVAPASAYAGGYCDAISADLLLPVAGCAVVLVLAALGLSDRSLALRAVALAVAGGAVVGAATLAFPACLSNPLDRLDPLLVHYWLGAVNEAQGILGAVRGPQGGSFAVAYAVAVAGVLGGLWLVRVGRARAEWAVLLAVLAVAGVFAAYQVRYLFFLVVLSLPVWASVIAELRHRAREGGGAAVSLAIIGLIWATMAPGLAMGVPFALPGSAAGPRASGEEGTRPVRSHFDCLAGDDFGRIAALPPGRVASTSNLGAYVLLWSGHEAISAPYHRNQEGMLGQLSVALAESPEEAARRLRALDVDYLVLCGVDPEIRLGGPEPLLVRVMDGAVALEGYPLLLRAGDIAVFGRAPG